MKVLSGFVSFCRYSLSRMSGMKYFPPREARRSIFFNLAAAVCTALLEAREYFLMNFSLMIFSAIPSSAMAYNSSFCLVGMPESISLYPVPASSMMESIVSRSFPALGMQLGENRLAEISG